MYPASPSPRVRPAPCRSAGQPRTACTGPSLDDATVEVPCLERGGAAADSDCGGLGAGHGGHGRSAGRRRRRGPTDPAAGSAIRKTGCAPALCATPRGDSHCTRPRAWKPPIGGGSKGCVATSCGRRWPLAGSDSWTRRPSRDRDAVSVHVENSVGGRHHIVDAEPHGADREAGGSGAPAATQPDPLSRRAGAGCS